MELIVIQNLSTQQHTRAFDGIFTSSKIKKINKSINTINVTISENQKSVSSKFIVYVNIFATVIAESNVKIVFKHTVELIPLQGLK